MENEIFFPLYFKCTNKAQFDTLNNQSAAILGTEIYQQPLNDANGDFWFIVNSEVAELVDISECQNFERIVFNQS